MKKIVSAVLALVLLLSALIAFLVSCNKDTKEPPIIRNPPLSTPKNPIEHLPYDGFGGESFHILSWTAESKTETGNEWVIWEEGDVTELNQQDDLSRAVFERNEWVEKTFDVVITQDYASVDATDGFDYATLVRYNAKSGDDNYQLLILRSVDSIKLIKEGLYADLNEHTDYLHFDESWWEEASIEAFAMGSHRYVATSKMLVRDKGATSVVYFNETLASDYEALPDFVDMAEGYEWTYEVMIESCEIVSFSGDGDDYMNSAFDMWGYEGGTEALYYLYNGTENGFAHMDEDGHVAYDFGLNDSTVEVMFDLLDYLMSPDFNSKTALGDGESMFYKGRGLFKSGMIKDSATVLQGMQDMYGILPHPLYTLEQEHYSSLVNPYHDSVLGIPKHAENKSMCAVVLEALSWRSQGRSLGGRYESGVDGEFRGAVYDRFACKCYGPQIMLNLILNSRSYDPGLYWDNDSGLHGENGLPSLIGKSTYDLDGVWENFREAVEKNIQEINAWVDAVESSTGTE